MNQPKKCPEELHFVIEFVRSEARFESDASGAAPMANELRLVGHYKDDPKRIQRVVVIRSTTNGITPRLIYGGENWELQVSLSPQEFLVVMTTAIQGRLKCSFDRCDPPCHFVISSIHDSRSE